MARPLTDRQQQVYEFIEQKITLLGSSPTVREIGDFLGIKSPNGVMCHLRALERKGLISRTANKSRAIELRDQSTNAQASQAETRQLPPTEPPASLNGSLAIRGKISEGQCRLHDSPQPFDWLGACGPDERYLLHYTGNGLAEHSIIDGDLLLVERQDQALESGLNLVQSLDGSVELKSDGLDDLSETVAQVIGVVVGVLRIPRSQRNFNPPHLNRRKSQALS